MAESKGASTVAGLLRRVVRESAWMGLRALVRLRAYDLVARLYARATRQIDDRGKLLPVAEPAGDTRLTVLALSGEFYRLDPQVLAGVPGVRVLVLPQRWQNRLLFQFYQSGGLFPDYMNPPSDSPVVEQKKTLRAFLRAFLPRLYGRLAVDCVVGPHVHYYPDSDWGAVSDQLGYPYIVLQRENMVLAQFLRDHVRRRVQLMGRFEGSHIIVHNERMRDLYIEAAIVDPPRISALGCVRMDRFVVKAHEMQPPQNQRKRVLYFPFYLGLTFEEPIRPFFAAAHVALLEFARDNPQVEVRLKPKPKFEGKWRSDLQQAIHGAGLDLAAIPNLIIRSDGDAQHLIAESDVVCGLQTTTLLEAGLAGRPVVIPYFKEMDDPKFDARVMFRDAFHYFDVAPDAETFKAMLSRGLTTPEIDPQRRAGIREVFSRYVSDLEGNATARYVEALSREVAARRPGRAQRRNWSLASQG